MTLLPIVGRELLEASRRPATYRGRVVMAGLATVVFLFMAAAGGGGVADGSGLFRSLLVMGALYGAAMGVSRTADLLSREAREGTLGLLFLTDLGAHDVVLGKVAAALVDTVYALAAVLPVMWLTVQLGGVSGVELLLGGVCLLNVTFAGLALGLWVSVRSVDARKALFAGWFCMFFWAAGPPVLMMFLEGRLRYWAGLWGNAELAGLLFWVLLTVDPFYGVGLVGTGAVGSGVNWSLTRLLSAEAMVVGSVLLTQVMSWWLLYWTGRRLRGLWRSAPRRTVVEAVREWWEQWTYGSGEVRAGLRRKLLAVHPVVWLMQRERGKGWYAWLYFGFVGVVWVLGNGLTDDALVDVKAALPGLLLLQGFAKVWVLSESALRLSEDRRVGAVELLLTTPLTVGEVVRGHWLGLKRQFLWPVVVFALLEFYVMRKLLGMQVALLTGLVLWVDLVAVAWAGMWCGATSRDVNHAIGKGVGLVLLLPWVLLWVWITLGRSEAGLWTVRSTAQVVVMWAVFGLLIDVVVGGWFGWRMRVDGRRVLTER